MKSVLENNRCQNNLKLIIMVYRNPTGFIVFSIQINKLDVFILFNIQIRFTTTGKMSRCYINRRIIKRNPLHYQMVLLFVFYFFPFFFIHRVGKIIYPIECYVSFQRNIAKKREKEKKTIKRENRREIRKTSD